ncbi:unnamed protein product [Didymodactylos carnosus]|uniref:Uncharacterized protein n=1 Tax=Didymodactylos carnosus TaxID=1234261 RepID=A0A814ZRJ2_9BILA|nr:unnamed protein product [Didymodactylos carnosus]CAF1247533.1 unnamed protein product [Didymodactylos carnosus]CAF3797602.1 unnamed protein product [Didymodactylos carnosus]CAF4014575.1 unnamed protein product [Didymodactylos carnosus]
MEQKVIALSVVEASIDGNQTDNRCAGVHKHVGSYDTYILHPPIIIENFEQILNETDIDIGGVLGGENRILYEMNRILNLTAYNPCIIIKAYHLHTSNVRTYNANIRINHNGKSLQPPPIDYLP